MSTWKTLGYVPDSDDEEDSLPPPAQNLRDKAAEDRLKAAGQRSDHHVESSPIPPNNKSSQTTAERLERIINDGLHLVRGIRAAATDGPITDIADDSPLSSLPSSIASSPPIFLPRDNTVDNRSQNAEIPQLDIENQIASSAPRRSLRARAPIQEHPYMLEDAKYRQLMKDRGIKPVHVPTLSNNQDTNQATIESQQSEDYQSSQINESYDFDVPSSPGVGFSDVVDVETQDPTVFDAQTDEDDPEDGLPDLMQILQQPSRTLKKTYRVKSKQKGTSHPMISPSLGASGLNDQSVTPAIASHQPSFRVPPSPPRSDHDHIVEDEEDMILSSRRVRSIDTPNNLPTPLISSENTRRKRHSSVVSVTDSDSAESAGVEAPQPSSPAGEEDESQGLRWIRQRLKGILPPSYVKFDMQNQAQKRNRQYPAHSTALSGNERGVARRMSSRVNRPEEVPVDSLGQYGEAESSDSEEQQVRPTNDGQSPSSYFPQIDDNEEDVIMLDGVEEADEGDEIDRMLPPSGIRRNRGRTGPRAPQQQRIDGKWAVMNHRSAADAVAAGLTSRKVRRTMDQGKASKKTKRTKLRHKPRPPEISIFEAPGFQDTQRSPPKFLKVAARQVRRSNYQIPENSSRKIFVLATEKDTHDVNNQLKSWKEKRDKEQTSNSVAGANVFRSMTRNVSRTEHRTTNISLVDSPRAGLPLLPDITELKGATDALLSKIAGRDQNQSGYDATSQAVHIVDVTADDGLRARDNSHLRSVFAHFNRSGRGSFFARTSKPRTAQLEASRPISKPAFSLPVRTIQKSALGPRTDPLGALSPINTCLSNLDPAKQANKKKPRKQTPRRSILPTAKMDYNELILPNIASENTTPTSTQLEPRKLDPFTEQVEHQIQSGIAAVKRLILLPEGSKFVRDSLVGGNTLFELSRSVENVLYEQALSQERSILITAPLSGKMVICREFNTIVLAHICTALDQICDLIYGPNSQSTDCKDSQKKCIQTLEQILTWLEESAWFPESVDKTAAQKLTEFIQEFDNWFERFTAGITQQHLRSNHEVRSSTLHCLNWMACIALRLHVMARKASLDFENKLQDSCWKLIGRAFEIVFEPEWLLTSLTRLHSLHAIYDFDNATVEPPILDEGTRFPEAETVIVAWQIASMEKYRPAKNRFYEHLQSVLTSTCSLHWATQLAGTLTAISFVLPFTQFTLRATVERSREVSDRGSPFFNLLVKCLQGLVAQVSSGQVPPSIGQMLEAVEDLCLKMINDWLWTPLPAIATVLLRVYSWNAMLPFNTLPDKDSIFDDFNFLSLDKQHRDDNDFFKFLDIVESCLQALYDPTTGYEQSTRASRIRALVFSLIPNNSQSTGAQETLHETHFLALKNYCSLYLCLLTRTPEGSRPRPKQLEQQFNLATRHYEVCRVAIATWKSLALFHSEHVDASNGYPQDVKDWMNNMLNQTLVRFNDHQQWDGITLLDQLLSALKEVVLCGGTEIKARKLLEGEIFDNITRLMNENELLRHNEKVLTAGLQLLHAYVDTVGNGPIEDTLLLNAQLVLRNIIKEVLNQTIVTNASLLRLLMSVWFEVARLMVRTFHKHWNDFIEPHSNLSIDFLSGLRNSFIASEAKQCFFGDLIREDQAYYFLELRPIVFMTWVTTLLVPARSMRLENVLTEPILRHEQDSLEIKNLAARILNRGADRELKLQDIADVRIEILSHIIQTIYGQQWDPEEEWLAGGLDPQVQRELLRTMTKTMKENWLDLKSDPVEQGDYTALVHAVLNEMETYPVEGFKIDPWFTGQGDFPRPQQTLDNIFKCRFGESAKPIDRDNIRDFRQQYMNGMRTGQLDVLLKDMIRVFHCVDPLRARSGADKTEYSIDFAKQAKFIQIVFPAVIACASGNAQSIMAGPIVALLTELTMNIQYRIDNLDPANIALFVSTTTTMMCEISRFLNDTALEHCSTAAMIRYIRLAFSRVCSLMDSNIELDESIFEMCIYNVMSVYAVIYNIVDPRDSKLVCDSMQMTWGELFDVECARRMPEMTDEENALRRFAEEGMKGWEAYKGGAMVLEEVQDEALALVEVLKKRELLPTFSVY